MAECDSFSSNLESFIELVPDVVLVSRASDGLLTAVNAAALNAYGYSRDELLGRNIRELCAMAMPGSKQCGTVGLLDAVHVRKDGSQFRAEVNTREVTSGDQEVRLSIVRNVSEKRHELGRAEESSRTCFSAFDQTVVGVARVSLEGRWLKVNQRLCSMLGYTEDELESIDFQSVTHPEDLEIDRLSVAGLLSGELGEVAREKRYICKNGGVIWVQIFVTLIRGDNDEPSHFFAIVVDISQSKLAEHGLKFFKTAIDRAPLCAYWLDSSGKCVYVNEAACQLLGYSREELMQMRIIDIARGSEEIWGNIFESIKTRGSITMQSRHYHKNGDVIDVEITSFYLNYGDVDYSIGFAADIRERLRNERERDQLQYRFVQAQKMESVGRLAGGVAHDFNNVLTIIQLSTQHILEQVSTASAVYDDLGQIENATTRAAELTRQLLTFARRQAISPQVLNLDEAIGNLVLMLRRLLGEDLDLEWKPRSDTWFVSIDPSQLDQLLANLCVNARDAIKDVGKVVIRTRNRTIPESESLANPAFSSGDFVELSVSDNGCGMDAEMLSSIFEPFFTTKPEGKGTGLGLATVYGIVKQNGGFIDVSSVVGQGTTFSIFLPRFDGVSVAGSLRAPSRRSAQAVETLMVVEDEGAILTMVTRTLKREGYTVLGFQSPIEAVRAAAEYTGVIHLLLTDVILPGMNGRELSKRLCEARPELRCVYMSGYTADVIAHYTVLEPTVAYIQKPFSVDELLTKLRLVLDE